jgi:exodeoxyribonuclease VII small subunit
MPEDQSAESVSKRAKSKTHGVPVEEHFQQIQVVIEALEEGTQSLEDSLRSYEIGIKAVRQARLQLDSYVARLEELKIDGEKAFKL